MRTVVFPLIFFCLTGQILGAKKAVEPVETLTYLSYAGEPFFTLEWNGPDSVAGPSGEAVSDKTVAVHRKDLMATTEERVSSGAADLRRAIGIPMLVLGTVGAAWVLPFVIAGAAFGNTSILGALSTAITGAVCLPIGCVLLNEAVRPEAVEGVNGPPVRTHRRLSVACEF